MSETTRKPRPYRGAAWLALIVVGLAGGYVAGQALGWWS